MSHQPKSMLNQAQVDCLFTQQEINAYLDELIPQYPNHTINRDNWAEVEHLFMVNNIIDLDQDDLHIWYVIHKDRKIIHSK